MSYLRPTCSDAAARVTNLGLSRYVPSIWQGDAQIESVANITPNLAEEADEVVERFPSQRPLDRATRDYPDVIKLVYPSYDM